MPAERELLLAAFVIQPIVDPFASLFQEMLLAYLLVMKLTGPLTAFCIYKSNKYQLNKQVCCSWAKVVAH